MDPRNKIGRGQVLALIRGCQDYDLTEKEYLILGITADQKLTNQNLVKDKVNMKAQAFSASVSKLIRLGFIHSVVDPTDRRKKKITATPKGRNAMVAILNGINRY